MEHFPVRLDYVVRRKTFPGWNIRPRVIRNYEIVLILQGNGEVTMEGKRFAVKPGDLFLFRPGVVHSLAIDREPYMEFFGAHFTPEDPAEEVPLPDYGYLPVYQQLEGLFSQLLSSYLREDRFSNWCGNVRMEQILCQISFALSEGQNSINGVRVRKAVEFIQKDPFRKIPLEQLLAQVGVKKSLFLDQFRKMTGTTPAQYVLRLKMEAARDYLLETDLAVAKISSLCGFEDPYYFSRWFKKRFHLSPLAFRKQGSMEIKKEKRTEYESQRQN